MKTAMKWIVAKQQQATKLALRLGSLYVGYRILHHEIWEADTSEPLLIGLGLWLCGLPPALFLESLRKLANEAQGVLGPDAGNGEDLQRREGEEGGDHAL